MKITDTRVKILKREDAKLKAVASIVFDEEFVLHDVKIVIGSEGPFVVMPSRKGPDGEYRDIAHPIKTSFREMIKAEVLKVYYEELKKVAIANETALAEVEADPTII